MRIILIVLLLIGVLSIENWGYLHTLTQRQSELLRSVLYLLFLLAAYAAGYAQRLRDEK